MLIYTLILNPNTILTNLKVLYRLQNLILQDWLMDSLFLEATLGFRMALSYIWSLKYDKLIIKSYYCTTKMNSTNIYNI